MGRLRLEVKAHKWADYAITKSAGLADFCYTKVMRLEIIAHPNSKKPRVEKDLFGKIQVYVSQPPLDGRANEAVILALAAHFQIKKSQIQLIRGHKSKVKTFDLDI